MTERTAQTIWARIYISGPLDVAKQILRRECMREGLCVAISPAEFIYTGGEETGYVVGINNYPRFPSDFESLKARAVSLAQLLRDETFQHSVMIQLPSETIWLSSRESAE